jgi:uncharacterized membrane protein
MLFLLLLATVLRFISLNQSLWLDEAINILAVRDLSIVKLLASYMQNDFHPPFYHLLMWIWVRIFPISEVAVRIPSVLFGVLTVYVVFLVSKEVSQNRSNSFSVILPAFLLAISALHIYYSQEARMYSMVCLFMNVTLLFLIKTIKNKTRKNQILYGSFLLISLLSDYQPWLLLPLLIFILPLPTIASIFLTFPIWPLIISQIQIGLSTAASYPAWQSVVGRISLKAVALVPVKFLIGRISIDNNLIYLFVILPALLVVLVSLKTLFKKTKDKNIYLLSLWLGTPLLIGVIISPFIPIFTYFRFLFLLPVFYLLVSQGITNLSKKTAKFCGLILIITTFLSAVIYLGNTKFQREDWRGLSNYMHQFPAGTTAVLFPSLGQAAAFNYYIVEYLNAYDISDIEEIKDKSTIVYIDYVADIFDVENKAQQYLIDANYQEKEQLTFTGIKVITYVK